MQLCNTCGFVLNESDFKCGNCSAPILDREAPIEQIQTRTQIEKKNPKNNYSKKPVRISAKEDNHTATSGRYIVSTPDPVLDE